MSNPTCISDFAGRSTCAFVNNSRHFCTLYKGYSTRNNSSFKSGSKLISARFLIEHLNRICCRLSGRYPITPFLEKVRMYHLHGRKPQKIGGKSATKTMKWSNRCSHRISKCIYILETFFVGHKCNLHDTWLGEAIHTLSIISTGVAME
ncbi:unnamed protein product [Albugo candida]|uniref:Uncharacterized protein n=1 Tax=Albugo candida TaxID=65357 RepID=A0A024FTL5_9STRA|nr:unnamed protein product [Albugo candida]|eukprot:CCI10277.1 unnamed protein product [Albugo candida]